MKSAPEVPGLSRGRVLEVEVMDDAVEVKAYLDGVATAHLDRMDDTFVAAALRGLARRQRSPLALDVGTGTGALPVKMALARPGLKVIGLDMAAPMLAEARRRARAAGVADRVAFRRGNSRRLPFADRSFDLVVSNSMLHHIPDPAAVMDEMSRVLKPGGALFVRDLRRPHPSVIARHIREHGRHYRGTMLRLFSDSVRAAFTESELKEIVGRSALGRRRGATVRRMFAAYLVVEIR